MSDLSKVIGQRLRSYRLQAGLSQEQVADLAGCHPTYIGQVERGEKNATLESIEKISGALNVPMATLFDKIESTGDFDNNIPLQCYNLLLAKGRQDQENLFNVLLSVEQYRLEAK